MHPITALILVTVLVLALVGAFLTLMFKALPWLIIIAIIGLLLILFKAEFKEALDKADDYVDKKLGDD